MVTVNNGLFWVGVALELVATVIQNVGLNMQKKAHHMQQMIQERTADTQQNQQKTPHYCRNAKWWIAIIVFVIGVILDFIALAFIPSTVSLPIGSIGLCVSAICAHAMLFEQFRLTDLIGTVLIVVAAWLIVGFSAAELDLLTIADIRSKFTDTQDSALWFVVGMLIVLVIIVSISFCWRNALTYAIIPGLCGVFTVLFGGIIGQLTLNTLQGNNQMNYYEYWLMLIALIIAVLVLNQFLQRALNAYDNMIVTPIYFTSMLLISVLSGLFFFKYFKNFTTVQYAVFGVSIVFIVVGCILLSVNHLHSQRLNITQFLKQHQQFVVVETLKTCCIANELNMVHGVIDDQNNTIQEDDVDIVDIVNRPTAMLEVKSVLIDQDDVVVKQIDIVKSPQL